MKKIVTLGVVGAVLASVVLPGAQASAATAGAHERLEAQSRELTEAAVTTLRHDLGLSDAEARRRFGAQAGLTALADDLAVKLGDRQAGSWLDPSDGTLVVNVVDDRDARTVVSAGHHRTTRRPWPPPTPPPAVVRPVRRAPGCRVSSRWR